MSVESRPFAGTWKTNSKPVVQHTPDYLVYLNGSLSLPGCTSCKGRVPIQKYIQEISVDASTEPGGANANITMNIPLHASDSIARDAKSIFRVGMEVQINLRGYFPVKGMFSSLAQKQLEGGEINSADYDTKKAKVAGAGVSGGWKAGPPIHDKYTKKGLFSDARPGGEKDIKGIITHESGGDLDSTIITLMQKGNSVHYIIDTDGTIYQMLPDGRKAIHTGGFNNTTIAIEIIGGGRGVQGEEIGAAWAHKQKYKVPQRAQLEAYYLLCMRLANEHNLNLGNSGPIMGPSEGQYFDFTSGAQADSFSNEGGIASHQSTAGNHADGNFPLLYLNLRRRGLNEEQAYAEAVGLAQGNSWKVPFSYTDPESSPYVPWDAASVNTSKAGYEAEFPRKSKNGLVYLTEEAQDRYGVKGKSRSGFGGGGGEGRTYSKSKFEENLTSIETGEEVFTPSMLEILGLDGQGIEDLLAYPYYPVFHGIVLAVSTNWSGGVQTISLSCQSMLHLWQFDRVNKNAQVITDQRSGDGAKMALKGSLYTSWHPYQIIWDVYFTSHKEITEHTLGLKTNTNAVTGTGDWSWHMARDYWERRFNMGYNNLRMHGVDGSLLSGLQAAQLGRADTGVLRKRLSNRVSGASGDGAMKSEKPADTLAFNLYDPAKFNLLASEGGGSVSLNMADMETFHWNTQIEVNIFTSTYASRLDMVNEVCNMTQFEFYQDVDGDFVFKPKMYNLDTSSSRVYRIEDIDIVQISFEEMEPQATYVIIKNNNANLGKNKDVGMPSLTAGQGLYVDWRLVAQFGYRPFTLEVVYAADSRALFYIGMGRLDALNVATHRASCTIPLRPELRPGYPVYIPYLDAYYYVTNFTHTMSVGSDCTTTLTLQAKRSKFYAPGHPDIKGIDAIDFSRGDLPDRPLSVLNNEGIPRLSGFPNVVLAIDPDKIKPLHTPAGVNLASESDEILLRIAYDLNIITKLDDDTFVHLVQEDGETRQKEVNLSDSEVRANLIRAIEKRGHKLGVSTDKDNMQDNITANYLNLLWDRKANFAPGAKVAGHYRYYSASHPDPEHQGQKIFTLTDNGVKKKDSAIEGSSQEVEGYVKNPNVRGAEAQLDNIVPKMGMYIYNHYGKEVVPTSEILTLAFTASGYKKSEVPQSSNVAINTKTISKLTKGFLLDSAIIDIFGFDDETVQSLFEKPWERTIKQLLEEVPGAHLDDYSFPKTIWVYGYNMSTEALPLGQYRDEENPGLYLLPDSEFGVDGQSLLSEIDRKISTILVTRWLKQKNGEEFAHALSALGVPSTTIFRKREVHLKETEVGAAFPIFPVSDAKGYTVIGSYQYGRGLDIEPGGVWDSLRKQAPDLKLNAKLLNMLIHVLVLGKALYEDKQGNLLTRAEVSVLPKEKRQKEIIVHTRKSAQTRMERELLTSLRKNYSDQDLLDLKFLVQEGEGSNKFHFSMANFFATSKDGIAKLPIVNAAKNLSELIVGQDHAVCRCKAMEANVLLDAYANEEFISPEGTDEVTTWLKEIGLQQAVEWKARQNAYDISQSGGVQQQIKAGQPTPFEVITKGIDGLKNTRETMLQAHRDFGNEADQKIRAIDRLWLDDSDDAKK